MGRVNEGGSILGFIVVAVLLAGALIGGVYFINRQQDQTRPTAAQPQERPAENKEEEKKSEQTNPSGQSTNPQTTPQAGPTRELPATGPGEVVVSLLMLGSITAVFASYLRSRRAYLSL